MKTEPNDSINMESITAAPDKSIYSATNDFGNTGLTKREHFAGLALQGGIEAIQRSNISVEDVAYLAVKLADELIDALNEKKV